MRNSARRIFTATLLLVLPLASAHAATYYVDAEDKAANARESADAAAGEPAAQRAAPVVDRPPIRRRCC